LSILCSRSAAAISLPAAGPLHGLLIGRTQRPEQKELQLSRITLILAVSLALSCTAAAAADSPTAPTVSQRADGRLLPDGADIPTAPAIRPDDRADRSISASSTEPTAVTGRPDGRTLPDAVDARTANPPVVIGMNEGETTSFDWLAALIGGLAVAGVALAVGGTLVARHHGPTPARR
jgi:hypothetical protein